MFNGKFSALFAAGAFVLSIVAGIFGGAGFPALVLRALLFALVFFGLASGAYWLVAQFLPELIEAPPADISETVPEPGTIGSRVDLTLGDDQDNSAETFSGISGAEDDAQADGFDGPMEILSGPGNRTAAGMDHAGEDGYTGSASGQEDAPARSGAAPALPSGMLDDVDVLPDLGSMESSFVSPIADESDSAGAGSSFQGRGGSAAPSAAARGGGTSGGDFDAREMASAIQTILKRDQKG